MNNYTKGNNLWLKFKKSVSDYLYASNSPEPITDIEIKEDDANLADIRKRECVNGDYSYILASGDHRLVRLETQGQIRMQLLMFMSTLDSSTRANMFAKYLEADDLFNSTPMWLYSLSLLDEVNSARWIACVDVLATKSRGFADQYLTCLIGSKYGYDAYESKPNCVFHEGFIKLFTLEELWVIYNHQSVVFLFNHADDVLDAIRGIREGVVNLSTISDRETMRKQAINEFIVTKTAQIENNRL